MNSRRDRLYECSSCGYRTGQWLGRCPQCGEWNSLAARRAPSRTGAGTSVGIRLGAGVGAGLGGSGTEHGAPATEVPVALSRIDPKLSTRLPTGIEELDRVLGGGVIGGSSVLISGEPGIGKSTLLLQVAASFGARPEGAAGARQILYVSGEEGAAQLRSRADRIGAVADNVEVLCSGHLETVLDTLATKPAAMVIIDSIQTLYSPDAGAIPATVNQIKYCCQMLADWARRSGAILLLAAHVTKEGLIAGPKQIEHLVDVVLYFEQNVREVRFLRSYKNRFGTTEVVGLMEMGATGLQTMKDPATRFLGANRQQRPAGVVTTPLCEGSRVLLVELQALTVPAKGGISRVFCERIEAARISRIAAVLEKHVGIVFSTQDIYVNVAGGARIGEVGVELALAHALFSARTGVPLPAGLAVMGEVSLAGEVHPVPYVTRRVATARECGYRRCIAPSPYPQERDQGQYERGQEREKERGQSSGNVNEQASGGKPRTAKIDWEQINTLRESIEIIFGNINTENTQ